MNRMNDDDDDDDLMCT